MDYMTPKDASQKWGISQRRIQKLCKEGRIEGVVRFNKAWAIPNDAKKPMDERFKINSEKPLDIRVNSNGNLYTGGDLLKEYSIQQVSELLHIPKDTLRYYDKLGLVSPTRGENRYRYYAEHDILDLQYIETMKYSDFTLTEIRQFFKYMRSLASEDDCSNIEQMFEDKKLEYKQKIKTYKTMNALVGQILKVKNQIESPTDLVKANELVISVFNDIKGGSYEK